MPTRVAILGWGSLLWSPGALANRRQWRSDGPWLPIEFARTSNLNEKNGRHPYLSLVVHPDVGLVRTYWDMSTLDDLSTARLDLQNRESCDIQKIGCLPREGAAWAGIEGLEGRIQDWLTLKKAEVDAVIWTNLGWKIPDVARFTAKDAVDWLRTLRQQGKSGAAEEYMRQAPPQIDTCVRRQAKSEFGWDDILMG
jgi:hypothetical protein